MIHTQLLVIGAGPYALSVAALSRERGIGTVVLGRPMGFWRDNMPEGMFLRSGPDWHLVGSGVHTLQAYLEESGIGPVEADPIPVGVFLDYAGHRPDPAAGADRRRTSADRRAAAHRQGSVALQRPGQVET